MLFSAWQWLKQYLETDSIDDGRQIDCSDEHPEKVKSPRIRMAEPGSNVKCDRFWHPLKQPGEIVSTDEGIEID
jgi:hypothetical protein